MPRPKLTVPKYYVDKTGRAFTKLNGRKISLGRADQPEAAQKFAKLRDNCAKGLAVEIAATPASYRSSLSINELLVLFIDQEMPRFSESECNCQAAAIRIL